VIWEESLKLISRLDMLLLNLKKEEMLKMLARN